MEKKSIKYPRLPQLVKSKVGNTKFYSSVLDSSISGLAGRLKGSKTKGKFSLDLLDKKEASYSIELNGKKAQISKDHDESAELHICTTRATWMEISSGRLSPVMAYLQGNMSVSGKLGFIKRVYALAAKRDDVEEFLI